MSEFSPPSPAFAQGLRRVANWFSRRGLAHLFVTTRQQEREVEFWKGECERYRQDAERAHQQVAEQAARFAEERRDILDRFAPKITPQVSDQQPGPDEWAELTREFGINPIERRVKQARWEDEQRYERLRAEQMMREASLEGAQIEEEHEAEIRASYAERARQAKANELGAI